MTKRPYRALRWLFIVLILGSSLSACRNETQNRLRRQFQDFTGQRLYISIISHDGDIVYSGRVDGKVTRASLDNQGSYVYWYDDRGVYHQTNLGYLLSSQDVLGVTGDAD